MIRTLLAPLLALAALSASAAATAQPLVRLDDTIQRNAGRNPNPESFSHGTSQQRVKWFSQGYQTGDFKQCNTFTGTV